jgi:DNA-binding NarL/FixJ family response regulator
MAHRILVVDDDETARRVIAQALRRAGYEVREAATADGAMELACDDRPALAVVEVVLPGRSGYEVCRELKDASASARVVLVSGRRAEACDRTAGLLLGADDYLVKPLDPGELVARVRRLLPRESDLPQVVRTRLTPRELEVLELLVDGRAQTEIADLLSISPRTVGKHVEHILAKLGVRSRAQAIALAVRERLVGSPVLVGGAGRRR